MNDIENAIRILKLYLSGLATTEMDNAVKTAIEALEKQLNNGWIPVSERLPKRAGTYIAKVKWEDNSVSVIPVWWHNGIRKDLTWDLDGHDVNVIAWQPLPESYKEVENGRFISSGDKR